MSPGPVGSPVNRAEFLARLRQGTSGIEPVEPADELHLPGFMPRVRPRVEGVLTDEHTATEVDPEDLYRQIAGRALDTEREVSDHGEDDH